MPVRSRRRQWLLRRTVAEFAGQIFHNPIRVRRLQFVRCEAVLPNGVTQRPANVYLHRRLRQQTGDETGEHVAAAASRQVRIAGRVDKNVTGWR